VEISVSCNYRIVIRGHVDASWSSWFGDVRIDYDAQDNTVLTGPLPDQPALFGILDRIRDLNLTLISVNRIQSTVKGETS
jgi:hypothetical protein